ncbi:PilX N-terminal domain-containing pilus assembly protein [Dyella sp. C11]|uniref:PilX N-terminal domain-containing pilus assembly protein n=1 Tax=Dyella sp. C11 TaxID=2126991 RepID=UPI000D641432|nr:PilX N-terminal domain-containing pilus assembly protein [Dyella sp. C11]
MRELVRTNAGTPPGNRGTAVRQQGVALFMGLVLLLVLTLVALVAMRGTLLGMRLTSSTAQHELAFESSEAARVIPEAVLGAYAYYHGWPQKWGGTIPDAQYQLTDTFLNQPTWLTLLTPSGSTGLQKSCNGALANFILNVPCISGQTDAYNYTPSQWPATFVLNTCLNGQATCGSSAQATNSVAIVRDGVATNVGSGAAAQQGYASIGVGNARGGALLMLQIKSTSTVPGGGKATTVAQYRVNIVN